MGVGAGKWRGKGCLISYQGHRSLSLNAAGRIARREFQKGLRIRVTHAWFAFEVSGNSFINESVFSEVIEAVLEGKP